jgi:hypothetical protein
MTDRDPSAGAGAQRRGSAAAPAQAGPGVPGNRSPASAGAAPDAASPAGSQPGARREGWPERAGRLLRQHWLFALVLAVGLVLRALVQIAYNPPLIYVDSLKYLFGTYPGSDPLGYDAVLKTVLPISNLSTVALLQHLLGLVMGVLIYLVLLRRGAARWLAALAAAPVLLDGFELQMEHMIMPDVWFEALVVIGFALLLWRPVVSAPFAIAAGLILGSSATVRQIGELLIFPVVLYLLMAGGNWRRSLGTSVALIVAFAVPIVTYSSVSLAENGHFRLARGQALTGRTALAADCATLKLRPAVRLICPTPAEQAIGADNLEHSGHSVIYSTPLPPGVNRAKVIGELRSAVLHQQPQRVAVSVLRDSVRLFTPIRRQQAVITPISRWQFQPGYPNYPPWVKVNASNGDIILGVQRLAFHPFHFSVLNPTWGGKATVNRPVAKFLRFYQIHGGYTPGPLLALCTLAGLAGSLLLLLRRVRRQGSGRTRQLALGCLLFSGTAVVVLLLPDVFEFSWRYQLPATVTLAPAGFLGFAALLSFWRDRRSPDQPTAS